jgi:carboxylesterase type B
MMDYWLAFMKDGKPSSKQLPDWPAYQPASPKVMVFGNESIAAR